jgi:hypothetical protein
MQMRYVTLTEAHPPMGRIFNNTMRLAVIRAYKRAIQRGQSVPPVPESVRDQVLAAKSRHGFAN